MDSNIKQIVEDLQAHLNSAELVGAAGRQFRMPVESIRCYDGAEFSIQAGELLYSTPRSNTGPWTHVEVMALNNTVPRNWECGDGLAGWVPIEAVAKEILERQGSLLTGPAA